MSEPRSVVCETVKAPLEENMFNSWTDLFWVVHILKCRDKIHLTCHWVITTSSYAVKHQALCFLYDDETLEQTSSVCFMKHTWLQQMWKCPLSYIFWEMWIKLCKRHKAKVSSAKEKVLLVCNKCFDNFQIFSFSKTEELGVVEFVIRFTVSVQFLVPMAFVVSLGLDLVWFCRECKVL